MRNKAIGIFDSGFGGLDILKTIVKKLPKYNYVYLGDSARAPYASRSQDLIYKFTEQAVDFLFKQNCQLIILACNTASSEALRKIQQVYLPKHYPKRRVLGVIIPAVEEAVELTTNNRIGIIGTEGTVSSKAFVREINKLKPEVKVFQKACPLFCPIVEAGAFNYVPFALILLGIEFLGACLDGDDWDKKGLSKKRIERAIDALMPKYKGCKKQIKDLRNGFAHHFSPSIGINLTHKEELQGKELRHLCFYKGSLILVVEDFYYDFTNACEKLIRMIKMREIEHEKVYNDILQTELDAYCP